MRRTRYRRVSGSAVSSNAGMTDRRTSISKICSGIIEIAIRLLVKISSVLAGYATAIALHRSAADLTGSLIFGISSVGAFAVLRPAAYRLYPKLRRSDLRRAKRGPNPTTLTALGILVLVLSKKHQDLLRQVATVARWNRSRNSPLRFASTLIQN